jgi:GAF domain-containing protein
MGEADRVSSQRRETDGGGPTAPLEKMLSEVREALEMDVAFVSEFVGDRQVFRALEGDVESFGVREGDSLPLEGSICKRIIESRVPNAIPDTRADERVRDLDVTRAADLGSYVGFPLWLSDGSLYGTLCCASHSPDPWLRERDLRLMGDVARKATERLERKGML